MRHFTRLLTAPLWSLILWCTLFALFAPQGVVYAEDCPANQPNSPDCQRAAETAKNPKTPLAGAGMGAAGGILTQKAAEGLAARRRPGRRTRSKGGSSRPPTSRTAAPQSPPGGVTAGTLDTQDPGQEPPDTKGTTKTPDSSQQPSGTGDPPLSGMIHGASWDDPLIQQALRELGTTREALEQLDILSPDWPPRLGAMAGGEGGVVLIIEPDGPAADSGTAGPSSGRTAPPRDDSTADSSPTEVTGDVPEENTTQEQPPDDAEKSTPPTSEKVPPAPENKTPPDAGPQPDPGAGTGPAVDKAKLHEALDEAEKIFNDLSPEGKKGTLEMLQTVLPGTEVTSISDLRRLAEEMPPEEWQSKVDMATTLADTISYEAAKSSGQLPEGISKKDYIRAKALLKRLHDATPQQPVTSESLLQQGHNLLDSFLGASGSTSGSPPSTPDEAPAPPPPPADATPPHISLDQARQNVLQAHGELIPADRQQQVMDVPVHSLNETAFLERYHRHFGADGEEDKVPAFVDRNDPDNPIIVVREGQPHPDALQHEMLHIASNADYYNLLGRHANEGATEYFSRKHTEPLGLASGAYQEWHQFTDELAIVVGEDTLRSAYLGEGKEALEVMRRKIDLAHGAGTFDQMVESARQGNVYEARATLLFGK